jgi:hypothetical protein
MEILYKIFLEYPKETAFEDEEQAKYWELPPSQTPQSERLSF